MIAYLLQLLFGRHASLEAEVSRLSNLVEKKNAEKQAIAAEQALLTQIAGLRSELGIG